MVENTSMGDVQMTPFCLLVAMETNLITPVTQELHEVLKCPIGHVTVVVTPLTRSCSAVT